MAQHGFRRKPLLSRIRPAEGSTLHQMLLAMDGSELAEQILPCATVIARALRSQVALLQVLETDALPTALDPDTQLHLDQLIAEAQALALEYLDGVRQRLARQGIRATVDVLPGSAPEAIVFLAHSQDIDLIALATHGRSGLGRWLMGSVSAKVVASADTAVLLVRAGSQAGTRDGSAFSRIVVPLDGSDLSERALPLAEQIARGMGASVLLARVTPSPLTAFSAFGPGPGVMAASHLLSHAERDAEQYLMEWCDRLRQRGVTVDATALRGPVADELLDLVSGQDNSLLIMGTHGRTGPGRYVLGSVADRLVHSAPCPIILVR